MKNETLLATLGSSPDDHHGVVNLPTYRASTILFPSYDAFMAADSGNWPTPIYGRYGTPSTMALEEALATVDHADHAIVTSSGLAAIIVSMMAFLKATTFLAPVFSCAAPAVSSTSMWFAPTNEP